MRLAAGTAALYRCRMQGAGGPHLSVIIPLADDRGRAPAAVRSWAQGQTCPRSRLELVVIAGPREDALARAVAPLLAAGDQLIRVPDMEPIAQTAIGAARASAPCLMFTESHCEAEPETADTVLSYLSRDSADGVLLACRGDAGGALARAEGRLFGRGAALRLAGPWDHLFLRSTALRREAYQAAGGLDPALLFFAEAALAIALHRLGRRIAFLDRALIHHRNSASLAEFRDTVAAYVRGESAFRAANPALHTRYLGPIPEWRHAGGAARRMGRAAWHGAAALARSAATGRMRRRAAAAAFRLAPRLAAGRSAVIAAAVVPAAFAALNVRIWRRDPRRLERWLEDFHARFLRLERIRRAFSQSPGGSEPLAHGSWGGLELPPERIFGFHPPEFVSGTALRWTRPLFAIELDLPAGRHRVAFERRGQRTELSAADIAAAVDGRPLPGGAIGISHDAVTIDFEAAGGACTSGILVVICARLAAPRAGHERRALGLPVFALTVAPVPHTVPGNARQ